MSARAIARQRFIQVALLARAVLVLSSWLAYLLFLSLEADASNWSHYALRLCVGSRNLPFKSPPTPPNGQDLSVRGPSHPSSSDRPCSSSLVTLSSTHALTFFTVKHFKHNVSLDFLSLLKMSNARKAARASC